MTKTLRKTLALILIVVLITLSLFACGTKGEEKDALDTVKTYITALEEFDTETQQECMDPSVNSFSEGLVNSIGDFFGISGAYDMANGAVGLLGSATEQALNVETNYNFVKVLNSNFSDNSGEITVQYEIVFKNKETKEKTNQNISWLFHMVKKDKKWYIQNYEQPVALLSDESGGKEADNKNPENTVGGKATKYVRSKSFSDGYAVVEIQLESESKYYKETRCACIDTDGIIQFFFPEGYYHSVPQDYSFYNGVCVLYNSQGTQKVMTNKGEELYTFNSTSATELSDTGCAVIETTESTYQGDVTKRGLMDNKGNWIFELSENNYFREVGNGVFHITQYNQPDTVHGTKNLTFDSKTGAGYSGEMPVLYEDLRYDDKKFLDINGNTVIDLSDYYAITKVVEFVNSRACVFSNGFTVILDKNGNMVCDPIKGRFTDNCYYNMKYSKCISIVNSETGKYCYYDLNGNLLFELDGLNIDIYSCGLLRESDGTYIDSNGTVVISSTLQY